MRYKDVRDFVATASPRAMVPLRRFPPQSRLSRMAERSPLDIVRQEAPRDDKDQRADQ